jgi:HlyD family secretion protein
VKKKQKIVLFVGAGLVLVISCCGLLSHQLKKKTLSKTILKVRTEAVKRGELVETVNAPGEIEPRTKVDISAKVSARVVELPYKEGERVTAGNPNTNPPIPPSVLVRLDDRDMVSRLNSAEASYEAQKAQIEVEKARIFSQQATLAGQKSRLEQARQDFERQKKLFETQDISQSAFDQAKTTFEELQAQVQAAEKNLQAAQLNLVVMEHNLRAAQARVEEAREALSYTTITAPIDGVITRLNAEVGEVVMTGTMNNPGTVILTVADLSQMILNAQVDESNIGRVKVGQPAKVHVQAFWDEEFNGTVHSIALTSSRSTTTGAKYYETKILLEGDVGKLYTGLTADVNIEVARYQDVLLVPSQAVLERRVDDLPEELRKNNPLIDPKKSFLTVVFRLVDGKTRITPVRVGPSDLLNTLIEEGLTEGDKVIVGPYKILETLQNDMPAEEIAESETQEPPHEPQ